MNKERRQSLRCEASIPCTVTYKGKTTTGKITNMSLGGAFITELATTPPEKAFITVAFEVVKIALTQRNVEIKASVDSSVIRDLFDIQDDGIVGSIGVQFQDNSREVQSQLKSIMRLLLS